MKLPISFFIKINHMSTTAMLNSANKIMFVISKNIIYNNNYGLKITSIKWLNKIGIKKLYIFLVIYLANKDKIEIFFKKRVIKIGRNTIYIKI